MKPLSRQNRLAYRHGQVEVAARPLPEEVPIALTFNRATYAVMLATPADLEDFAIGFSLNEGIVSCPADVRELDVVTVQDGIECRMWLDPDRLASLDKRRRAMAGPTGCGLCGLDSLAQAVRPPARVEAALTVTRAGIEAAMRALAAGQVINRETRAVHAAGFWAPGMAMPVREDVGRHNALDKLAGALARGGWPASAGVVTLTSRVSVELVQKAAAMGAPVLAAVSVPTALAVRTAEQAGITLIAIARDDGFEVFTHPHRIEAPRFEVPRFEAPRFEAPRVEAGVQHDAA